MVKTLKGDAFILSKMALPKYSEQRFRQLAKKVMSDSLGLVDFAIGLVVFVLILLNRQVLFYGEMQITEGL